MRKLTACALVITGSAALLVAAPAVAGGPTDPVGGEVGLGVQGGLRYLSETLDVGSSGHFDPPNEASWIACGQHASPWKPSSGGARVSGGSAANLIAAMRPMDLDDAFETPPNLRPDDWWDSTVRSVVGRSLTGYTICTKKALRYVRTETPDGASSERTGSTSCPPGFRLVGGGAFIATTGSYVNSSFPKGNTWRVRVFDTVGGLGGMESYAVCRRAGGVQTKTIAHTGIANGSVGAAVARCTPKTHVIGGGGRMSGAIGEAHLAASLPIDGPDADSVPDDGWKALGYNSAGTPKSVRAYAICVQKG